MSRRRNHYQPGIAVSLLALSLWACDAGRGPEPHALLGPSLDAEYNQGTVASFRRVRGADGEGSVSATIGATGGKLTLGEHELFVPRGAVDAPTLFQMTLEDADYIQVDLTATQTLGDGTVLDVGERGFRLPVTLKLSYQNVLESVQPSQLTIVWMRPDGILEQTPSRVIPGLKRVESSLDHFSRYAVAIN